MVVLRWASFVGPSSRPSSLHRWRPSILPPFVVTIFHPLVVASLSSSSIRPSPSFSHPSGLVSSFQGREAPRVAEKESGHIPRRRGVARGDDERGREGRKWWRTNINDHDLYSTPYRPLSFKLQLRNLVDKGAASLPSPFIPLKPTQIKGYMREIQNLAVRWGGDPEQLFQHMVINMEHLKDGGRLQHERVVATVVDRSTGYEYRASIERTQGGKISATKFVFRMPASTATIAGTGVTLNSAISNSSQDSLLKPAHAQNMLKNCYWFASLLMGVAKSCGGTVQTFERGVVVDWRVDIESADLSQPDAVASGVSKISTPAAPSGLVLEEQREQDRVKKELERKQSQRQQEDRE
ncbi:hypothetical protein BDN70DRAFT_897875 [Pholiota conissans]|uniref:Uncharacterized protein n=1 Tax=Pholiota conissans TaxID=109636 RepID=A0A9P6CR65_9AGAR|nr:hypothetical protein BDN70DRAFT_897875 [Pholiota conissans]